jgi:chromosome segregation ATPase
VAAAPVERGHDGPDRAEIVQLEREVGRLRATVTSLEGQLTSAEAQLTAAEHRANTAEAQLMAAAAAPVAPRSEAEDALSLLHHARATASATVDAATLRSGEIVAGAEAQARQLLDEAASFARTLVDEAEARRHATDARVAEVEAELARYQQLLTSVSIDLRDAATAINPDTIG